MRRSARLFIFWAKKPETAAKSSRKILVSFMPVDSAKMQPQGAV